MQIDPYSNLGTLAIAISERFDTYEVNPELGMICAREDGLVWFASACLLNGNNVLSLSVLIPQRVAHTQMAEAAVLCNLFNQYASLGTSFLDWESAELGFRFTLETEQTPVPQYLANQLIQYSTELVLQWLPRWDALLAKGEATDV